MEWTKQLPAKSGFYWYREDDDPEVVRFDVEVPSVWRTGNDCELAEYMSKNITGEFWPVRLEAPL